MSTGTFSGGVCYSSQYSAAADYCSRLTAMAADGTSSSCSSIMGGAGTTPLPTDTGGAFAGVMKVVYYTKNGTSFTAVTTNRFINLQDCETFDYAYWSPYIAAWTGALVAVIAARSLYRKVFDRETL